MTANFNSEDVYLHFALIFELILSIMVNLHDAQVKGRYNRTALGCEMEE